MTDKLKSSQVRWADVARHPGYFVTGVAIGAIVGAIVGAITWVWTWLFMLLWNAVVAGIFHGPSLTHFQAFLVWLLIVVIGSAF